MAKRYRPQARGRSTYTRSGSYDPARYYAACIDVPTTGHKLHCRIPPPAVRAKAAFNGIMRGDVWYIPDPDDSRLSMPVIKLIYEWALGHKPDYKHYYLNQRCKTKGCCEPSHYSLEKRMYCGNETALKLMAAAVRDNPDPFEITFEKVKDAQNFRLKFYDAQKRLLAEGYRDYIETWKGTYQVGMENTTLYFEDKEHSTRGAAHIQELIKDLPAHGVEAKQVGSLADEIMGHLQEAEEQPSQSISEMLYGRDDSNDEKKT